VELSEAKAKTKLRFALLDMLRFAISSELRVDNLLIILTAWVNSFGGYDQPVGHFKFIQNNVESHKWNEDL
jgi:hypothetical protein